MSEQQKVDLSEIPGLGPVRREALAEAGVTDLAGLLALKVSELAAIRGIGMWQARKVREYLRQEGLLVEVPQGNGAEGGDQPILVHAPETPAEARAVTEAVVVMEAQAQVEAEAEAEVERLSEALAAAGEQAEMEQRDGEAEPVSSSDEESGEPEGSVAAEDDDLQVETDSTNGDVREDLRERRERLPEVALTLIEAIRQAAVNKQLTRQVTRLLITSGEFVSDSRQLTPENTAAAADALAQAEALLQRALEKEAFSEKAQKELADRIRKRRKALDRLLERTEVEDR